MNVPERWHDPLIRGWRTFKQGAFASLATGGVLAAVAATGAIDINALKAAGIMAAFSGIVALVSVGQNRAEESGKHLGPK